jgi:hypothetical protein
MFLTHFLYQLVSAIAIVLLLWLLWRRTRSAVVLAFVGLHPLVAVSIVNGGHPDALIALAFAGGYFLALDRRIVAGAIAFALGIAINFSVVVVAVALAAWALRRWPRRDIVKFAAIAFGFGAFPYVLLAGWLQNAHEHQQLMSRQSIWNPVGSLLDVNASTLRSIMPGATTFVAGALLLVVVWRASRGATPDFAIAAALGVFLVTSPWVMPWYAFAAFPFIALRRPNLLAWCIALYSALILVGDQFDSLSPNAVGSFTHALLQNGVPLLAAIACVVSILARSRGRQRDAEPDAAGVLATIRAG